MTTYIAFLRGINAGANPTLKMQVLKDAFEAMGFENVRTVIASGNVIFEAEPAAEKELEQAIEKALPGAIGFKSDAIVYNLADLQKLAKTSPLKDVKMTATTRPFVTFLKEAPKETPKLDGKGFQLLGRKGRALFSVVHLSSTGTPDLMSLLDREFGKKITTRSWKTIEKILQKK